MSELLGGEPSWDPQDITVQPTRSLFERLPEEIVIMVLEVLCDHNHEFLREHHHELDWYDEEEDDDGHDDVQTLVQLSLVSCRMNRLTTPYLYRSVCLSNYGQNIRSFLRAICSRPDLTVHVRLLYVYWADIIASEIGSAADGTAVVDADAKLFLAAAKRAGIAEAHLLDSLQGGKKDAQAALILYLLPNLQQLYIKPALSYSAFDEGMDEVFYNPLLVPKGSRLLRELGRMGQQSLRQRYRDQFDELQQFVQSLR